MNPEQTLIHIGIRHSKDYVETQLLKAIFDGYCFNPHFVFYEDVLNQLPDNDLSPFDRIEHIGGAYGNQFLDILLNSRCGNYNRFISMIGRVVYYFNGNLRDFTISNLRSLTGIDPYTARLFVLRVVGGSHPIYPHLALISSIEVATLRRKGWFVPNRIPHSDYWKYEYTFLNM